MRESRAAEHAGNSGGFCRTPADPIPVSNCFSSGFCGLFYQSEKKEDFAGIF